MEAICPCCQVLGWARLGLQDYQGDTAAKQDSKRACDEVLHKRPLNARKTEVQGPEGHRSQVTAEEEGAGLSSCSLSRTSFPRSDAATGLP